MSQGVQILDATIKQQLAIPGNSVLVQGYSQSAIIASLEMRNLLNPALNPTPPTGAQLGFNLLGDPMNPNGGLLERFVGLTIPSLGLDFYGATPSNTPWTSAGCPTTSSAPAASTTLASSRMRQRPPARSRSRSGATA